MESPDAAGTSDRAAYNEKDQTDQSRQTFFLSMKVNGNVMGQILKVVGEHLTLIQEHFF